MLELSYSTYSPDESILLAAASAADEPIDEDRVQTILAALDRLFGRADYDTEEYVIYTADTVPSEPGEVRRRMWEWIEKTKKELGASIDVWGRSGEYVSASMDQSTHTTDDFGRTGADRYCVETDLASSLETLAKFHQAWRMFVMSEEARLGSKESKPEKR